MFKWLDRFFKKPAPVRQSRNSSASITAMIDTAIQKADKETKACTNEVEVKARRATNASRRVIANTGQYKSIEQILKESEKT